MLNLSASTPPTDPAFLLSTLWIWILECKHPYLILILWACLVVGGWLLILFLKWRFRTGTCPRCNHHAYIWTADYEFGPCRIGSLSHPYYCGSCLSGYLARELAADRFPIRCIHSSCHRTWWPRDLEACEGFVTQLHLKRARAAEAKRQKDRLQNMRTEDKEMLIWIIQNTKLCPSCYVPIVKADGCQRVLCTLCEREMCYGCGNFWGKCRCDPFSWCLPSASVLFHRHLLLPMQASSSIKGPKHAKPKGKSKPGRR